MEWYYADENEQKVSFPEEEFQTLVSAGKIRPDTLVWNSTMQDWAKASDANPSLFPLAPVPGATSSNAASASSGSSSQAAVNPPAGAAPYGSAPAPQPNDGLAIASLICGIFAILMSCGYGIGIFPGVAAIICGHMSKKRINEGGPAGGSGMATAGLVMGYIGAAISVLMVIFLVGIVVFAGMSEMETLSE